VDDIYLKVFLIYN